MELKKNQVLRDGIIYDNQNKKYGQIDFPDVQIDTLSYVSLSDKVIKILGGVMDFKADPTVEQDFDEPYCDNWENRNEDILEVSPIDEYSDSTDIIEVQNNITQKVEATKIIEGIDEPPNELHKTVNQEKSNDENKSASE